MRRHRLRVRNPFHILGTVEVNHVDGVLTLLVKGQPCLRVGPTTAAAVGEMLAQAARDYGTGRPEMAAGRAVWLERDDGSGWQSVRLVALDGSAGAGVGERDAS